MRWPWQSNIVFGSSKQKMLFDSEPLQKASDSEATKPKKSRQKKKALESGSRYSALWLLILTVLVSLLFYWFGNRSGGRVVKLTLPSFEAHYVFE